MPKKIYLYCYFIVSLFSSSLLAQELDLQSLNVDKLSDGQLFQLGEKIQNSGMSFAQLESLARVKGMSSIEIDKLKVKLQNLQKSRNRFSSSTNFDDRLRRLIPSVLNDTTILLDEIFFDSIRADQKNELKVFGREFFKRRNREADYQNLNIATPSDYPLGPGDELNLDIWGASEQNYSLAVSPDGYINVKRVGPIYVSGLSIERAEKRLKKKLSEIYAGLTSKNGEIDTYIKLTLGGLKTIAVNVVGEVEAPGTYQVNSLVDVLHVLRAAGGPSIKASFRSIEVYRTGKKVHNLDLYNYFISGDYRPFRLQNSDIILVKPVINRVVFTGQVKRPAIYEVKHKESLAELLKYSGGFQTGSFTKYLKVYRLESWGRGVYHVEDFQDFELANGDSVVAIKSRDKVINSVNISGAINLPGDFRIEDDFTLKQLVVLAGGPKEDAFLERILIKRVNDDLSQSLKSVNYRSLLQQNENLILRNQDSVIISSIHNLKEPRFIEISGEISQPGMYPFMDGMTVEDLIVLAGGFLESAISSEVEVARKIKYSEINDDMSGEYGLTTLESFSIASDMSLSSESSSFLLRPFDHVTIRKSRKFQSNIIVHVSGQVVNTGDYVVSTENERISSVIRRAGGLRSIAFIDGAVLRRRKMNKEGMPTGKLQDIGIELDKIMQTPGSKYDLILEDGDAIYIPRQLETVSISGELLNPSTVRYDKSMNLKDYVSKSGGFTDQALRRKVYVKYPNGYVNRTNKFFGVNKFPRITPGSEIMVPKKRKKERLRATEIIGISSGLSSLMLVLLNVINN